MKLVISLTISVAATFPPCIQEIFTTAGPTAAAALAIEFLPRHPGQHLESSEFPPEAWLLRFAGGTDADAKEFSIGKPPVHRNLTTMRFFEN